MTRLLLLLAALLTSFPAASAQGLYAEPGDGGGEITDGPPVLAGATDDVTAIGETMRDLANGDLAWGPIWWIATTFSPHIPVDPNCPPPDGCADDPPDEGDDPPGGGDITPGGGENDPSAGGETPPGGGATPPDDGAPAGDDETPQTSTAASSSSNVETYSLGGRDRALDIRRQVDPVEEGAFMPGSLIPGGDRVRLVSKREVDPSNPGEYQLRFEVVHRGRRPPTAILIQGRGEDVIVRVPKRQQRARRR